MTVGTGEFCNFKHHPEYTGQLIDAFCEQIEPVYGDQTHALQKIAEGVDRECELFVDTISGSLLGIIVYKTTPTMEYAEYGARNALDLKTLFVVNPIVNSGKGIGSALENRVNEIAREKFDNIQVTVSQEKEESLQFFIKKGWKVQNAFPDKYRRHSTEFLFTKGV